jgi:nucleoside-diphosphate-sugar epimerase
VIGPSSRPLGRVLLTGARGFLGAALRKRLTREGIDLVAADTGEGAPGDGVVSFDLLWPDEISALFAGEPFDTVLHCGAVSGPMVLADRPADIWRINVQGTADLLEAARRSGAGRVVVCSSVEIYGTRRRGILHENAPPDPPGIYGASKLAAEAAVLGYYNGQGLDVLALRLGWIYGPGRKTPTTLDQMLRAVHQGFTFELQGHPDDVAHYIFLDDAVSGLIKAADAGAPSSRVFNIVGPEGQTMGDVVEAVQRLCPRSRVAFARLTSSGEGPNGYSSSRANDEIGFGAKFSLYDGLACMLQALDRKPYFGSTITDGLGDT